jgi:uncharacterized protein with ATP-grasp and redox domains
MEYPLDATPNTDFIYWFYRFITEVTGSKDPWSQVKMKFNKMAMDFYPLLKEVVSKSKDPLLTAAIIAGAGNIIDEAGGLNFSLKESIKASLRSRF